MWSRFEFKASLAFTGYPERATLMDGELARVGLGDVYRVWQFPCPFDRTLQERLPHNRAMGHPGFFNSVIGHYRALKTAYCLGVSTCLVMEDDIRFLSDLDRLAEILDDIPKDYDIALLDVLRPMKVPMSEFVRHMRQDRVGRHWVRFSNARSAACYAMSRRGMRRWLDAVESPAMGRGGMLRLADQYFNVSRIGFDVMAYHASPVAARQVMVGDGRNNSGFSELDTYYRSIGCDPGAYGG